MLYSRFLELIHCAYLILYTHWTTTSRFSFFLSPVGCWLFNPKPQGAEDTPLKNKQTQTKQPTKVKLSKSENEFNITLLCNLLMLFKLHQLILYKKKSNIIHYIYLSCIIYLFNLANLYINSLYFILIFLGMKASSFVDNISICVILQHSSGYVLLARLPEKWYQLSQWFVTVPICYWLVLLLSMLTLITQLRWCLSVSFIVIYYFTLF